MLSLFSVFFSSDFFLQCQVVARASAHDNSADLSSSAAFPLHFLITEDVKKWTESIESGCSSGVAKRKAMQSNHMLASLSGCRLISLLCCSFCFKVNPLTHTQTHTTHSPLTPPPPSTPILLLLALLSHAKRLRWVLLFEMELSGAVGQSLLSVYSDFATHACQLFGSINQVLLSEILFIFLPKTCAFSKSKCKKKEKKNRTLVLNPITMPGVQPDMTDK